jgi:hypothetical protein
VSIGQTLASPTSTLLTVPERIGSISQVSAKDCQRPCSPALQKALHPEFPDQTIWLASYEVEKHALQDVCTYKTITVEEYRELYRQGAPQAIPTMCVLVIKLNKNS